MRRDEDVVQSELTAQWLADLLAPIAEEERRCARTLNLVANENRTSDLVLRTQSSELAWRYLLGRPEERQDPSGIQLKGDLMLDGLPAASAFEAVAHAATQRMFSAAGVDLRPLSGLHATIATLLACTEPGHVVYSISPAHGGHFATASLVRHLGRESVYMPWDAAAFSINPAALRRRVQADNRPGVVLFDHGTPLFPLPLAELREAVPASVRFVYDASHTLGLIAGGTFQDPLREGCDVLQGNTHKTMPGPQKGMIMTNTAELTRRLDAVLSGACVSSQHTHHTLALCLTLMEMDCFGYAYAHQVVENAIHLAEWLAHLGFPVFTLKGEATRSHLILLHGFGKGEGYAICESLHRAGIKVNARQAHGGEIVRFGVQEMTRRGMKRSDIRFVASFIARACARNADLEALREEVQEFMGEFDRAHYSFDRDARVRSALTPELGTAAPAPH